MRLASTDTFELRREDVYVAPLFSALQDGVKYTVLPYAVAASSHGLFQKLKHKRSRFQSFWMCASLQ